MEEQIISGLSSSLEMDLASNKSMEELRASLSDYINDLINHDFNKLVALLYRIDISEKLLKQNLEQKGRDAATVMADMIIHRQIQKIRTRQQFRSTGEIPDGEEW